MIGAAAFAVSALIGLVTTMTTYTGHDSTTPSPTTYEAESPLSIDWGENPVCDDNEVVVTVSASRRVDRGRIEWAMKEEVAEYRDFMLEAGETQTFSITVPHNQVLTVVVWDGNESLLQTYINFGCSIDPDDPSIPTEVPSSNTEGCQPVELTPGTFQCYYPVPEQIQAIPRMTG